VQLVAANLLAASAAPAGGGRGMAGLSTEEQKLVQQGAEVFTALCASCHGPDGRGQALAGAAVADTMMAPPLIGSPRVRGHRDYVIKVLLHGLTGPIDGTSYSEVMVPMGGNSDAWVAGVASYVRTSLGNAAGLVTAADVARVRADTARRRAPWTLADLEPTLPRALEATALKASASHNTVAADNALTLRGWTTGEPQAPGMWFQVELAQPAAAFEIQFESPAGRGGGAGGRGAFGRGGPAAAAPAPAVAGGAGVSAATPAAPAAPAAGAGTAPAFAQAPPGAPNSGFPRGYAVTLSMDGKTWTKPVAAGKGAGARTIITFAPTRAKFVRITQTEAVDGGPPWSITSLRVYERPAAAK
jgi:mono/diheme cytochrome c family protein